MRKFKIVFNKFFYPLINFKEFLIYITKFYEYFEGQKFVKKFNKQKIKLKSNHFNILSEKNLLKLNSKIFRNNKLINFYLNNKNRGMTKFIHYLHNYQNYFSYLNKTKKKIKILEIGVFSGGSLDMYKKFFGINKIQIIGIDIDKECLKFNDKITKIEIGDQEDIKFLNKIKRKYSKFDLIIDDGGHTYEQQKTSFEYLYPNLSDGGIYIIEDVSHRFLNYISGFLSEFNTIDMSKNPPKTKNIQKEIMITEIMPNCIVIRKYKNEYMPETFNCPWVGSLWTNSAKELYKKYNPNSNRFLK